MLSSEAIDKIIGLAKANVQEIDGEHFHVNSGQVKLIEFNKVETVKLFSLTQFLNFVKAHKSDGGLIDVVNETKVRWIKGLDKNQKIIVLAETDFSKIYEDFPFENQLEQENFIINLLSKFELDYHRDELQKLVSSVKAGKTQEISDNGYAQEAMVKKGVTLTETVKIKNIWELTPFKTFPEVDQPQIPYLLRLHQRGEETPKFALYDCDGGKWRVDLTIAIRSYVESWLTGEMISEITVL